MVVSTTFPKAALLQGISTTILCLSRVIFSLQLRLFKGPSCITASHRFGSEHGLGSNISNGTIYHWDGSLSYTIGVL